MGHKCLISCLGEAVEALHHSASESGSTPDRTRDLGTTGAREKKHRENLQNTVFFFFFFGIVFTFSIDVLHCYIVEVVLVISICKRG